MPESTIEPRPITVDKIRNGKATLICRWNIRQEVRESEMEDEPPQTMWRCDEAWLGWALPASFTTSDGSSTINMPTSGDRGEIRAYANQYVDVNAEEIMSYAKATKLRA